MGANGRTRHQITARQKAHIRKVNTGGFFRGEAKAEVLSESNVNGVRYQILAPRPAWDYAELFPQQPKRYVASRANG